MLEQVDVNSIPVDKRRDGATRCRLRGNVADTGAARTTGETPIGDECDLVTQAHTHNIGGRR